MTNAFGDLKDNLENDRCGHSDSTGNSETSRPYLEFQQVSKSFESNVVLDNVSFAVMPGETVCVMGRSGVGKSVCLRILMGFIKPDSGRVIVAGEDIAGYSEEQLDRIHKKVTMVFQGGALFDSLTVGENVAYVMRERGELNEEQIERNVDSLLDMVGISAERDRLPGDISIGMKRSVAIARALAESPEAVLYDEPTTMVDPLMVHRLGDLIGRLKIQLKLTSIVVTHDTRLAERIADHVLFLDRGKALFFGTPVEMERSSEPRIQEFLSDDRLDFHVATTEKSE
ncbi:MAG: ATP-binding cassette domain-containing protein [Terracidiphilus sp.]|jgi:phospholipid/cholesterol/gamma-HCH transport system ATP-binding protein